MIELLRPDFVNGKGKNLSLKLASHFEIFLLWLCSTKMWNSTVEILLTNFMNYFMLQFRTA